MARNRIYSDFVRISRPSPEEVILDVGVSDVTTDAANALERLYPYPDRVIAAGLGAGDDFRDEYPDITYRQIEADKPLPFADGAFDIVTSNAVLEHVGSEAAQRRLVAELMRVGRRVFLTVPNRFFPIEHHTAIPFLHWADSTFALACRLFGKEEWSKRENLILMSRRSLRNACWADGEMQIGHTGLLLGPCSANLYLYWDGRGRT